MLRPQSQHFTELKDHKKFVVESSDVIEDSRVFVREEGSERVFWYKERFLTDDEIVENVVENATSRVCWTIHRPKRGWYIRIRAPPFPPGVAIPLTPLPASSPFYTDAALTFSTRINPRKGRSNVGVLGASGSRVSSPPTHAGKPSVDVGTEGGSGDTVVHSYPPTPSSRASKALGQPPSPDSVRAKLDRVTTAAAAARDSRIGEPPVVVKQFMLAPHSSPHVHVPEQRDSSLIARALSAFRNSKPSHSLSFTLCPLPESDGASLSASAETSQEQEQRQGGQQEQEQEQQPGDDGHSRRHSIVRIGELLPPSPPPLITFHDRSPAWSLGTLSGILEVDTAMEREFGVDRSFWVTVALAYMEFLVERESYLAASGG